MSHVALAALLLALSPVEGLLSPSDEEWKPRFEELARKYLKTAVEERAPLVDELGGLVFEAVADAKKSPEDSERILAYFESHARLFETSKELQDFLRRHHAIRFQFALRLADGPGSLEALKKWCVERKLDVEKERVQAVLANLKPPSKPSGDLAGRAKAREQREVARGAVADFMRTRAKHAAEEFRKLIEWMKKEAYAPPDAKERVIFLVGRALEGDPAAKALVEEIKALGNASAEASDGKPAASSDAAGDAKKFQNRLELFLKDLTVKLMFAVDQCIKHGEAALGFDLFQYLLRIDPENKRAHQALGHVLIQGRWLRPYEADRFKAGWEWDPKLAWVLLKEKDRYAKGEWYDGETKKWDTVANWNKLHAEAATPWRLAGEHFDLVSTADLGLSAEVLARLEAFFLQAFRQYDLFFAPPGDKQGAKLVFGVAPAQKRLTVNFYRDAEQFKKHANPPTEWAAGFYSGGTHASYFHAVGGRLSIDLLQHEITHQILGEFASGGAPSWLGEGAAVFLEDCFFKDGTMVMGGLKENEGVNTYARGVKKGEKEHTLKDMLKFRTGRDWDSGDIAKNYRGAGAVVFFLMNFDGGRYRGDFIEMLRDAYHGGMRSIEDYFGLSTDSLEFLMNRFYKECNP
jgi:hypothetical protein